jgi:hypothetical protein
MHATDDDRAEKPGASALWDPEFVREQYVEQRKTMEQIAEDVGCTVGTVHKWVNEHGLADSSRSGGGSGRGRVPWASYRTNQEGYETWAAYHAPDSTRSVLVHRLLAVAEYGFDAVGDKHVHHRNHIPWDNRPANIEPLSPSEHMQYHADHDGFDEEGSPV